MTPREDDDKSEEDVAEDDHVASSRAGKKDDGTYVGRTFSDDAIDAEETGAEARSDDRR
ncbi:hypothetical protein [Mycolicibacterium sp. GF69]|uniref:hypothetical protein n=1 Tax=Mycolicibacterium sp. GF69 TaxID=2267251 RepID=UPI001402CBD4|nr:hypothetical protein [Mycolicibacterium sp. GF69]